MTPRSSGIFGKTILALLLAAAGTGAAWAQYVWLDEKGVKQYSDRPPPASVPAGRILKPAAAAATPAVPAPGSGTQAKAAEGPSSSPAAPATAMKGAPSIAERNAEFNKRRAEQADKDRKSAEQERLAAEKTRNCERAASYKRSLEAGARIARVNANGEQAFLSDDQRAQEIREANKLLEACG